MRDIRAAVLEDLNSNRTTHPLCDCVRFRKHIESAWFNGYEFWARGEAPKSPALYPATGSR